MSIIVIILIVTLFEGGEDFSVKFTRNVFVSGGVTNSSLKT